MSKKIVITGANRGIGKEIAKQLSRLGHYVIMTGRSLEDLEKAAIDIELNGEIRALDVSQDDSVLEFGVELGESHEHVDVVINNAGITANSGGVANPKIDAIREIMETNFYGPMRVNAVLIPFLQNSEEGRIINISSGMGALDELESGGNVGYRISKTGLNAQTRLLHGELRDTNIAVNSMCPGWVKTDMGGPRAPRELSQGAETAVWLATANEIPSGEFIRDRKSINW